MYIYICTVPFIINNDLHVYVPVVMGVHVCAGKIY